jgi:hypothetical protein
LKLQILNEFNVLKQGDTKSEIRLQLLDFSEKELNLTGKTVNVVIANSIGKILEKTPAIDSTDPGVIYFQFTPDDITGYGDMRLEVHVIDSDGKTQVIPSNGYYTFRIDRSLDELAGGNVTSYTLQHFIDEVDQKKAELEGVANKAIDKSNEAMNKATDAETTAAEAVGIANEANTKADFTQTQLDQVTGEGTIDPAVEQMTVDTEGVIHPSPDARLRSDYTKVSEQLAQTQQKLEDSERQTQPLNYGLNVLDGKVGSPARFQMEGRTLVNGIGHDGNFEKDSDGDGVADGWKSYLQGATATLETTPVQNGTKAQRITSTATDLAGSRYIYKPVTVYANKYYLLAVDMVNDGSSIASMTFDIFGSIARGVSSLMYIKFNPTADKTTNVALRNSNPLGEVGWVQFDGVRLYEITDEEYNKIGVEWNDEDVANRYPYVDDVKHIQAPFVMAEGKNLVNEREFLNLDGYFSESDGYISRENDTSVTALAKRVVPNQDYTLSALGYVDTSTTDIKDLRLRFLDINGSYISGTTIQLSFSSITSATRLSGICTAPSNAETLEIYSLSQNAGKIYFKDVQLELGNKVTPYVPYNPSYKYWMTTLGSIGGKSDLLYEKESKSYVEKWIEKDIVLDSSTISSATMELDYQGYKLISIVPKVFDTPAVNTALITKPNGVPLSKYISAYDKADISYNNASAFKLTLSDVETMWGEDYTPTSQEIKDFFDANPHKLSYVRANPKTEIVQSEGSIVVNGLTQVEVESGVVVREKANPVLASDGEIYSINAIGGAGKYYPQPSTLANKASEIIKVYRNTVEDTLWNKESSAVSYGNQNVFIPAEDYDPSADYYVSYLVLNRHLFTSNPADVLATYAKSVGAALNDMAVNMGDLSTQVSIHDPIIYRLLIAAKANGWDV